MLQTAALTNGRTLLMRITKKLAPPDCHFVEAAMGWLELGNPSEALVELSHVSPTVRQDPAVLETQWQILARTDRWNESLPVAQTYCEVAPGAPQGWLHQAVTLYRLNRTQEAWNLLLPMAEKFPKSWVIAYDLACYACQLEKIEDGRRWLRKAFHLHEPAEVKLLALADPDLKVLWPEIEQSEFDGKKRETA
jgi:predicted Zn-dependent protease